MAGRLAELSPRDIATLYVMAENSHDTGTKTIPAGVYFRGWTHLAAATGWGEAAVSPAARRAVARSLAALTKAGFINPIGRRSGHRHAPMGYEITP